MADTVFVGSHLKAEAFAGMNGDPSAASLEPGQKVKRGSFAKSVVAENSVSANAGDWQTRPVSAAQKVPTTPTMRSRNGEGGKVPLSQIRKANAALIKR